jgi:hypothetical protein
MEGWAVPQSLILLKKLPDPDYLHNRQAEGIYRASMNFLPGGCYEGAALFDASPSYATPRSATLSTSADSCPDPTDTAGCLIWEVVYAVGKLSNGLARLFNSFLLVKVAPGHQQRWMGMIGELHADLGDDVYLAAGHLLGCGPYNAVVEILSDDHERMHELQLRVTDHEAVQELSVGRVAAHDTRGWGEDAAPTASDPG